jgi:hypothetical protein
MSHDRGRDREIFALRGQVAGVTVISTESAAECVKKTVTPGDATKCKNISISPSRPLSRDMKQKNVIGVVACIIRLIISK